MKIEKEIVGIIEQSDISSVNKALQILIKVNQHLMESVKECDFDTVQKTLGAWAVICKFMEDKKDE